MQEQPLQTGVIICHDRTTTDTAWNEREELQERSCVCRFPNNLNGDYYKRDFCMSRIFVSKRRELIGWVFILKIITWKCMRTGGDYMVMTDGICDKIEIYMMCCNWCT